MTRRPVLLTLASTFGGRHAGWGLDELVDVRISPTMHDLYMRDLGAAWADPEVRRRLIVVGPSDYFYKWRGDEFAFFEESPLAHLLDRVDPRYAAGSALGGLVSALPIAGGNHQLLFVNRRLTSRIPATFDELMQETWRLRDGNTLLWPFVYPTNACYFMLPLLVGCGAPLWSDPAAPELGIPRAALHQVLALHRELMYDRIILPVKWEQYHSVFEFQTGRAAFCFGGDWDIASHREVLGADLAIAPIPSLAAPCRSTASCFYLLLSSELDPACLEPIERAAELLLGEPVQRDIADHLHRFPARRGLELDRSSLDPELERSYQVFRQAIFLPPYRVLSHIYHVLSDVMEPGVLVRHPLDEVVDRAFARMQEPDGAAARPA